ncbi:hypothetical protein DIZ27_42630 [Streptomyces sp. NWU339]|uniref:hypothetical protein n=1 Tax=Streptomyces sp. NWU339 TaxID=2185284 RepID=UPI000D67941A|nr:hypothetical protein [Streptomyces sp. NWU339]PWI04880.1 hypothetical protein DIZ27_42630 [Streptomyces sp. NWU339]
MTDRRPLGTGPTLTATEADTELPPAPRAQLAAERLPTTPSAGDPMPTRPITGRRALGAGPGGNPQPPTAECTAAQPPTV